MNGAQPGLDERNEPHRIVATTQPLAGPLQKAPMRRANDRGTGFGEIVEGTVTQLDNLSLPTRPLLSRPRRESKTVKQSKHASARTFDFPFGQTCVVHEFPSSTTAGRDGAFWPIVSLPK